MANVHPVGSTHADIGKSWVSGTILAFSSRNFTTDFNNMNQVEKYYFITPCRTDISVKHLWFQMALILFFKAEKKFFSMQKE